MRIVLSCMLICTMADDVIKARPNRMLWRVCVCWMFIPYLFYFVWVLFLFFF